jgi:hypothetical protein
MSPLKIIEGDTQQQQQKRRMGFRVRAVEAVI